MKSKLLLQLIMLSKNALYGILLQALLFNFIWAADTNAQEVKNVNHVEVNLNLKDATLIDVFRKIESQTNFVFSYINEEVDRSYRVTRNYKRTTLSKVLLEISRDANLKFKQVNNNINVTALEGKEPVEAIEVIIQTRNITGKVTSMEDGEGLPGVNVVEKGTSNGTVTNVEGQYSLEVSEGATLVFSSVGYTPEEVEVGNRSVIDLTMTQDIQQLQELVVVGYGVQKKSDLTGSVASVKSETIEKQGPKTTLAETLQGVVPGLNLTQNTNSADQSSFNIQIRGRNSITANNSPLIILDGVPYSGGLNEINQNDIESIDVLKDASSTAIYGSRGANGVIIITTKKGEVGKPRISYNGSYGIKQIYNMPPLMNGEEHYNFSVERYGEDIINGYPTRVESYQNGVSTDWVDLATRNGNMQQHTMNLEGGFSNVKYFLSGSYNDVEGVAVGDDFTQYIGRANIQVNITDWLEIATNTQYTFQDLSGVEASFSSAFFMLPLLEPYNDDGSLALRPWPEEPNFSNPLSNLNILDEQYRNRLFSNNYVKIDFPFLEGLSYKLNVGITNFSEQVGRYWGPETIQGFENNGIALTQNSSVVDMLYENILSYNRSFDEHNFNFTALYSTQEIKQENQSINSRNFPTHVLTWYQHNVAELIEPSSSFIEQSYVSQMARLNYSYAGRYLITATARRDGYSGFGEDNKYGIFPSIALGWNIGDESFLSQINWLDQLKLRFSYGENGNQAINPYQTMATLAQMSYLTGTDANLTAPGYFPAKILSC